MYGSLAFAVQGLPLMQGSSSRPMKRRLAIGITICALTLPIGLAAIASGIGLLRLPEPLFAVLLHHPMVFPAHMIASGMALMIIPLVVLLRRRPAWHRPLGRLAAVCVLIGGFTSLPVAMASEASATARSGFAVQGTVWVALLAAGLFARRAGNLTLHARYMLAMAAVTSGAIWLRLSTMAAVELSLPFEPTYAAAAWLGWLLPLLAVARLTRGLAVAGFSRHDMARPDPGDDVARSAAVLLGR